MQVEIEATFLFKHSLGLLSEICTIFSVLLTVKRFLSEVKKFTDDFSLLLAESKSLFHVL